MKRYDCLRAIAPSFGDELGGHTRELTEQEAPAHVRSPRLILTGVRSLRPSLLFA